jgi:hypothetical protein
MKKLLLIAVMAGDLVVAGTTRSDAQVYFSIGFGPGYYGYYPYGSLLSLPVLLYTLLSILLPAVLPVRWASLLSQSSPLSLLLPALV